MSYVELHAASAFSFLEGASLPEDLVDQAVALGYKSMALVDRQGLYGAPRFYRAAKMAGLRALVGAEVCLDLEYGKAMAVKGPKLAATPAKTWPRVTLLVSSRDGYKNLCRLLTAAALAHPKGESRVSWDQLSQHAGGLYCLTGGDEGVLAGVLDVDVSNTYFIGLDILDRLSDIFPGRVYVELQRHLSRAEEYRNRLLVDLAATAKLPLIATNGVRYARPKDKELFDVLTCLRLKTTLDAAGQKLTENRERYLKTPQQMAYLFRDLPQALRASVDLSEKLDFTLADLGYRFPEYPLPPGETPITYLRRMTWEGAQTRFPEITDRVKQQLERELDLIGKLDLAGYFLIVWDIIQFCKREKILVQGRGSAANSAVCYSLSITAIDPIKMELLFERFLSENRDEWPDIDLDLPSGDQRERVIQYVYRKYGAQSAAMTANVISYRPRSALRDVGKVLGYSEEQLEKVRNTVGHLTQEEMRKDPQALPRELLKAGLDAADTRVRHLMSLWMKIQTLPRHLGQHSGGMVIAAGRLDDVVPLEPATMPGRVVVQWDKDDCADLGIVKVDLLGLGMLDAIEKALPMIEKHEGVKVDLAHLPANDPAVYKMLQEADTVGLFQVESRAQMAVLPRHRPTNFYDIVVQVAIIRPGPIVGGMVKPFFERRQGKAPIVYPHPSLEPVLKRTLGVPLFQEQVIRMAMVAAGFTGGEAEELRRAIGFKRSQERMTAIEKRLREGMAKRGIPPATQDQIVKMITSFAMYGFPESHAASFALIAYASAYLKAHHPAAFYASLLNAWPMGFYHPATIVKDAQCHAVDVRPIDVQRSAWECRWEGPMESSAAKQAVRLGMRYVHGLHSTAGERIELEQAVRLFQNVEDLAARCALRPDDLTVLAHAGALSSLGLTRREALWQAARLSIPNGPLFDGHHEEDPSPLPEMNAREETAADLTTTHITTGPHFLHHLRAGLRKQGVLSVRELAAAQNGTKVRTAGAIVVRQRPGTAKGFLFMTLEDETGMSQAIVNPKRYAEYRSVIVSSVALIVEGVLQKEANNLSVKVVRLWPLDMPVKIESHDFR